MSKCKNCIKQPKTFIQFLAEASVQRFAITRHGGRLLCTLLPEARALLITAVCTKSALDSNKMAEQSCYLAVFIQPEAMLFWQRNRAIKRVLNTFTVALKFDVEKLWLDAVCRCENAILVITRRLKIIRACWASVVDS